MGGRSLRLKYVHTFIDRTRVRRYYFRRQGKRTPLPGLPGSPEFVEAYQACLANRPLERPTRSLVAPRSLRALALAYFGSPNFLALSQGSQSIYRRTLEPFLLEHGHRPAAQMQRKHVIAIMGAMVERPGAASMLLKRLRVLLRFGIDIEWLHNDPTLRVRSYRSHELHTWTEDEIAQFEARWPIGSKQRLAFALLLHTGQRGSDVRRMVWTDIAGGSIRVTQQKTGTKLVLPLHPDLQAILTTTIRHHAAILTTAPGRAFTPKGFGNFIADAIRAAGLPSRCKAHGLRKAAARRLAEAGCSTSEIASFTGHKSLSEIERYTRAANQELLASRAIAKQVKNEQSKSDTHRLPNQAKTSD